MSGILNSACDEIVGPEFSYQPSSGDSAWDQLAAAYIAARMEAAACDVRGAMDKTTQLKTTLRAVWTDGDQLQVDVAGGATQFFEADELVQPRSVGNSGKTIVNGVELDGDLRAVAYHVLKRGVSNPLGFVASLDQTQAIPASQARLVAYRKRVTQTRGVPFLASILCIYQRLDGYLDSETLAADGRQGRLPDHACGRPRPRHGVRRPGNETSDSVSSQLFSAWAG